jgi:protein-tyrosine phosphatase
MTSGHKQAVVVMVPEAREKVFTIGEFAGGEGNDIVDPFGSGEEVYQRCADEIFHHLTRTWQKILEFSKEKAGENSSA